MSSGLISAAISYGQYLIDVFLHRHARSSVLASTGASVLAIALAWCVHDYQKYLRLRPGGPPYNLYGWALITFTVRPFALSASDAIWTGDYPATGAHGDILALPPRQGDRALVGGIAPHRQLSQHPSPDMKPIVHRLFNNTVKQNPTLLTTKLSEYERHNPALFVHPSHVSSCGSSRDQEGERDTEQTPLPRTVAISRGEIGHIHPNLSIHLYLSPADARVVVEKGWAERHRLARQAPFLGRRNIYNVAGTYLMVYGPRDVDEMAVLATILRASVRFMTGEENVDCIDWQG